MSLTAIWFVLVGVLFLVYAILDGFDFGVGILSLFGRSDEERRIHMNAIGPVWDGNEVWLVTAGGALFAAFPPVYATVFEGFYIALMLLLAALIFRAVSFEFRGKVEAPAWRRFWDLAFGLGSLAPALLLGVALGNLLRGIPIDEAGMFRGGFLGLLNPYALCLGLTSLCAFTLHGAMYMALKSDGDLRDRMGLFARRVFPVFAVFFLVAHLWTALGMTVLPEAPAALRALARGGDLVIAVALVAALWWALHRRPDLRMTGFALSCAAIGWSMVFALIALFPRLAPSSIDPAYSLTIHNTSSGPLTLRIMLIIALTGVPAVIAYQSAVYWIFRGKVVLTDDSY